MDFGAINEAVAQQRRQPDAAACIGMGMLAVGLLFKVGAAPFQAWMPDVYQGAPTAVTAFMAAATKAAAFGAMLRLFYVAFGERPLDLAADDVGDRDPHHDRRHRARAGPDAT